MLKQIFLLFFLFFLGCTPQANYVVTTVVNNDFSVKRSVNLSIIGTDNIPDSKLRLADYFQFPPAEYYDNYIIQPTKALFTGEFPSFSSLPPDLIRVTPASNLLANNAFSFQALDLGFFIIADYEESLLDIVDRKDGEKAIEELFNLLLPELMALFNARYSQQYDLSRLEPWFRQDLLPAILRLYDTSWEIRRAKRSGLTALSEDYELHTAILEEAQRHGLILLPADSPNSDKENVQRLRSFFLDLLTKLCPPKQSGTPPLNPDFITSQRGREDLLGSLQKTISARHGSLSNFLTKIETLLPRISGAYLASHLFPLAMLPKTNYAFTLKVPGTVIQTNALRDLDGNLLWHFSDSNLAYGEQKMWVRSIVLRKSASKSLGLGNYPRNLSDVNQLFTIMLSPSGTLRETLLRTLQQSISQGSLDPLLKLSQGTDPDSSAAANLLALFSSLTNN